MDDTHHPQLVGIMDLDDAATFVRDARKAFPSLDIAIGDSTARGVDIVYHAAGDNAQRYRDDVVNFWRGYARGMLAEKSRLVESMG